MLSERFAVIRDRAFRVIVLVWVLAIALGSGVIDHLAQSALPVGHVALAATLSALHFFWPFLAAGLLIMYLSWLVREAVAAGIAKGLESLDISGAVEQGIRNAKDSDDD
jgi:hypothetical protein